MRPERNGSRKEMPTVEKSESCYRWGIPVLWMRFRICSRNITWFMENGLEAEQNDELGYRKYDYKNKDIDNSRNVCSSKTLRTSLRSLPRIVKGI